MQNIIKFFHTLFDSMAAEDPVNDLPHRDVGDLSGYIKKPVQHGIVFPEAQSVSNLYNAPFVRKIIEAVDIPDISGNYKDLKDEILTGIILGDCCGSPYECCTESRTPDKPLSEFPIKPAGFFTDDTVMTLASLKAVEEILSNKCSDLEALAIFKRHYKAWAKKYPDAGYGSAFFDWAVFDIDNESYMSCGDGSAMRAGIIGAFDISLKECIRLSVLSALPTHAHPEGIRGAVCIAVLVWLLCHGHDKPTILQYARYFYPGIDGFPYDRTDHYQTAPCDMTLDTIKNAYPYTASVLNQTTVPLSISFFLLSDSYHDIIRLIQNIACDADTCGAIAGALGGAFYKLPDIQTFDGLTLDGLDSVVIQDSLIRLHTQDNSTAQTS